MTHGAMNCRPHHGGLAAKGLITALTGVALLDLGEIYGASISNVSHLITTRSLGGLLGSLLGGMLYDTYNTQITSILMLLLTSVTVLMVPLCPLLLVAHFMAFFMGLSLGAFGTGANVWIINMWPGNSSPALHIFHFAFTVGLLVAPLIAGPFLSPGTSAIAVGTSTHFHDEVSNLDYELEPSPNATFNESFRVATSDAETTDYYNSYEGTTVYYAFGIASAFYLFLVLSMTSTYCIDKSDFKRKAMRGAQRDPDLTGPSERLRMHLRRARMHDVSDVAHLCSRERLLQAGRGPGRRRVFFFFAASRLVAAIVALKVSSRLTLIFTHGVLVTTALVMTVWRSENALVLWVGSAMMGFGQGPVKAAIVAWTAEYITISNKMMSVVMVTGSIGNLAPALLVGQFVESDAASFLYVSLGAVLLCAVMFLGMYAYITRRRT
nr:sodium-dependent glucose transporter 1-like [Rhipicephalus microplus]